jgi:hypothetical protein
MRPAGHLSSAFATNGIAAAIYFTSQVLAMSLAMVTVARMPSYTKGMVKAS